jgi:preprotein translocase subunit SecD
MKIIYRFIMLTVAALTLSSCNYAGNQIDADKMTKEEKQRLVELARSFLLRNKNIATQQERFFIKTNDPIVDAVYEGYKTGKTTIAWDTGKRKIVARLYGDMTGENHKWRISVYFKEQISHTPKSKVRTTPIPQGDVKDFSDMFKSQAVAPKKKTPPPKKNAK